MYYQKLVFIFFSMILVHNSATAMKRPHEGDQESKPKRIKLLVRKEKVVLDQPTKCGGLYYCSKNDCSYNTRLIRKIDEHHRLHKDSAAIPCTKCDYLGASNRAIKNHIARCSMPSQVKNQELIPVIEKEKCPYCGIEGENLERHKQVYHTPGFGKRSYYTSFPLNR